MRFLIMGAAALALAGCGYSVFDAAEDIEAMAESGLKDGKPITSSDTSLGEFSKLASVGPDKIIVTTGGKSSIRAEGDSDVVGKLRYRLKDGKLVIGREESGWSYGGDTATIYISAAALSDISIAGSGDIEADRIESDNVKLRVAGSGNLKVAAIKAQEVKGTIAGGGDLNVAGETGSAKYSVAGSGDIRASELRSETAKASVAGSGNIALFASGNADAKVAGSGDISVTGGAKCDSSTVGSGEVKCN